jgi:hypothetical protein
MPKNPPPYTEVALSIALVLSLVGERCDPEFRSQLNQSAQQPARRHDEMVYTDDETHEEPEAQRPVYVVVREQTPPPAPSMPPGRGWHEAFWDHYDPDNWWWRSPGARAAMDMHRNGALLAAAAQT